MNGARIYIIEIVTVSLLCTLQKKLMYVLISLSVNHYIHKIELN